MNLGLNLRIPVNDDLSNLWAKTKSPIHLFKLERNQDRDGERDGFAINNLYYCRVESNIII